MIKGYIYDQDWAVDSDRIDFYYKLAGGDYRIKLEEGFNFSAEFAGIIVNFRAEKTNESWVRFVAHPKEG